MAIDHTNINPKLPYEMPGGKCAAEYDGESYKEILKDNAPELNMGIAPNARNQNGKKEKTYEK